LLLQAYTDVVTHLATHTESSDDFVVELLWIQVIGLGGSLITAKNDTLDFECLILVSERYLDSFVHKLIAAVAAVAG
jgi:hypothetical protein